MRLIQEFKMQLRRMLKLKWEYISPFLVYIMFGILSSFQIVIEYFIRNVFV